jgi:hypothetical protein
MGRGRVLGERLLADRRCARLHVTASWGVIRPFSDLPVHGGRTVHDRLPST